MRIISNPSDRYLWFGIHLERFLSFYRRQGSIIDLTTWNSNNVFSNFLLVLERRLSDELIHLPSPFSALDNATVKAFNPILQSVQVSTFIFAQIDTESTVCYDPLPQASLTILRAFSLSNFSIFCSSRWKSSVLLLRCSKLMAVVREALVSPLSLDLSLFL